MGKEHKVLQYNSMNKKKKINQCLNTQKHQLW